MAETTDNSKMLLEAIDAIGKKINTNNDDMTAKLTEAKAGFEKKILEVKGEYEAEGKQRQAKIDELTETLTAKGKTIDEMRDAIKEMKAAKGRFGSGDLEKKASTHIAEMFEQHFEEIKNIGTGAKLKLETKASGTMTQQANLTGQVVTQFDLNPAVRGRRKINIRDLVQVINSATGSWTFYRENIPAPDSSGSFGSQFQGSVKNQVAYSLTAVNVVADYLAGFVRFAKQMAQDLPFLQTFIANELIEDYKRSESGLFLPQLVSAANGSSTVPGGVTVLAEKYIYWIANLKGNDYDPSAIVTTAINWGVILNTKPLDYSVPGGVRILDDGTVLFCGMPLLVQNNMVASTTLIGDWTKAAIIQTEGLSVTFWEQDSDNVQRNLITAKAEARVGFAVLRTDAFINGAN